MKVSRLSYDSPKMTRDEAIEICIYHLRVAAALFQLTPEDDNASLTAEINRQTEDVLDCDRKPLFAFINSINVEYNKMKERD